MLPFSTVLLRLTIAVLLGALIGIERECRGQDAGLRTNTLVALGTALFTIISATAFQGLLHEDHIQMDPTRIASYVVAGIGFLGGGSIYLSHNTQKVKGLTTAAAVWSVAAIGMACGAGLILEAITASVLAIIILVGLRFLEGLVWPFRHTQVVRIEVVPETPGKIIGRIYDILSTAHIKVVKIMVLQQETEGEHKEEVFSLDCQSPNKQTLQKAMNEIHALEGVQSIQIELRHGLPQKME